MPVLHPSLSLPFTTASFDRTRIAGVYYPALTAACALGERILNHLIIAIREDFRTTPQYRTVARKDSFDNWDLAIDTLHAWDVLLPSVVEHYRHLRDIRHRSICISTQRRTTTIAAWHFAPLGYSQTLCTSSSPPSSSGHGSYLTKRRSHSSGRISKPDRSSPVSFVRTANWLDRDTGSRAGALRHGLSRMKTIRPWRFWTKSSSASSRNANLANITFASGGGIEARHHANWPCRVVERRFGVRLHQTI
jgi:hypothetical protein